MLNVVKSVKRLAVIFICRVEVIHVSPVVYVLKIVYFIMGHVLHLKIVLVIVEEELIKVEKQLKKTVTHGMLFYLCLRIMSFYQALTFFGLA